MRERSVLMIIKAISCYCFHLLSWCEFEIFLFVFNVAILHFWFVRLGDKQNQEQGRWWFNLYLCCLMYHVHDGIHSVNIGEEEKVLKSEIRGSSPKWWFRWYWRRWCQSPCRRIECTDWNSRPATCHRRLRSSCSRCLMNELSTKFLFILMILSSHAYPIKPNGTISILKFESCPGPGGMASLRICWGVCGEQDQIQYCRCVLMNISPSLYIFSC